MKILLVNIAKGRVLWADEAVKDYLKRASRSFPASELQLKPSVKKSSIERAMAEESAQILKLLRPGDRLIALDERGESLSSEQLAELVQQSANQGTKRVIFAIGGSHGHDPVIRKKAWRTISLSSLVLNHQVARLVLAEQIYRATTIIRGEPYHH